MDRLYGLEMPVLESVEYAMDLASPRLLGRDVRGIVSESTAEQLDEILSSHNDRLIRDMARAFSGVDDTIRAAERLLDQFRVGFESK